LHAEQQDNFRPADKVKIALSSEASRFELSCHVVMTFRTSNPFRQHQANSDGASTMPTRSADSNENAASPSTSSDVNEVASESQLSLDLKTTNHIVGEIPPDLAELSVRWSGIITGKAANRSVRTRKAMSLRVPLPIDAEACDSQAQANSNSSLLISQLSPERPTNSADHPDGVDVDSSTDDRSTCAAGVREPCSSETAVCDGRHRTSVAFDGGSPEIVTAVETSAPTTTMHCDNADLAADLSDDSGSRRDAVKIETSGSQSVGAIEGASTAGTDAPSARSTVRRRQNCGKSSDRRAPAASDSTGDSPMPNGDVCTKSGNGNEAENESDEEIDGQCVDLSQSLSPCSLDRVLVCSLIQGRNTNRANCKAFFCLCARTLLRPMFLYQT
jgi:hypothetical protein